MGSRLGGEKCGLLCTDTSGHIVSHDWQYAGDDDESWPDDPDIILEAVTSVTNSDSITIQLSGDVAKYQSIVTGEYVATDKFSMGRHVYQNTASKLYLSVKPRYK